MKVVLTRSLQCDLRCSVMQVRMTAPGMTKRLDGSLRYLQSLLNLNNKVIVEMPKQRKAKREKSPRPAAL